ncbi:NADPH:quinone reductase [Geosmithia morbida]|uniref:Probable quinone oxidoreductase n=1 Tax=Geosmithia morbida TaxID=1094350 RepID=A0A9P5D0R8_9HYPO|nr:NADPH:quinone reductase [Geosmithia morbida]KAF4123033.1 NADPH:quinone reductase [Geosmithia morbida]
MAPVDIPKQAKAVQIDEVGGVEVLRYRDVPVPTPAAGQVLVRNEYSGVNFIDTYIRSGLYPSPSFPLTLGREGAGVVVRSDGSDGAPAPGTRVAYVHHQAYAEYTVVPADRVVEIPDGLSTDKAAAVLLQGLTAWTFVREAAAVQAGQWVLVPAAAGGVGLLLCQMLRHVGAKVIGTASTDEKLELARKHGAQWTVDSNADVVAEVARITGGHGVDTIFDGVGKDTFDADLEIIAHKGTLISFGNASGPVPPLSISRLTDKNVKLMRPALNGYIRTREELVKYTSELLDLVATGKLVINIYKVYPLRDAAQAQEDIAARKTTGKLLLKTSD